MSLQAHGRRRQPIRIANGVQPVLAERRPEPTRAPEVVVKSPPWLSQPVVNFRLGDLFESVFVVLLACLTVVCVCLGSTSQLLVHSCCRRMAWPCAQCVDFAWPHTTDKGCTTKPCVHNTSAQETATSDPNKQQTQTTGKETNKPKNHKTRNRHEQTSKAYPSPSLKSNACCDNLRMA